jgi:hypothetical protein
MGNIHLILHIIASLGGGAMTTFAPDTVWKASTEPKCRLFGWLVMHDRVLTTDNMARRNWPCNLVCPLCYCLPETTPHLLSQCNFVEASWNMVATRFSISQFFELSNAGSPSKWMQLLGSRGTKIERKKKVASFSAFGGKFGRSAIEGFLI